MAQYNEFSKRLLMLCCRGRGTKPAGSVARALLNLDSGALLRRSVACLALACPALPMNSFAQQPPPAAQEPTIKVQVEQVLVPVVVTDRKGHWVTDLEKSDFHVFEDGVEQKVVAFRTEQSGAADLFPPDASPAAPAEPVPLSGASSQPPPRRTYLVVVDTLSSSFGNFSQVRDALRKLFEEEKGSDSQYALVTLGRPSRVLQNLTCDPGTVLGALQSNDFTGAIKSSQASDAAQQEAELTGKVAAFCRGCQGFCGGAPLPSRPSSFACQEAWDDIIRWANNAAQEREASFRDFVDDLRGLTQQLSHLPGRRMMVLISDGFNFRPGHELFQIIADAANHPEVLFKLTTDNYEDQFHAIVRLADAANVTFSTLDSRGVYAVPAGGFDATQDVSVRGVPQVQLARQSSARQAQDAMRYLAGATGGEFFDGNNTLKGLRQSFADGRLYYVLAYVSTNRLEDGKFRAIRVQVQGKNLIVRAKSGYWAPTGSIPEMRIPAPAEPAGPSTPRPAIREPATQAPSTTDSSSQSFVDLSIAELVRKLPALKNLKRASSQELLATILQKVGANVALFFNSFPNVTSRERVSQQRLTRVRSEHDEVLHEFHYLALANPDSKNISFQEYRTDSKGHIVQTSGTDSGYLITKGFVSIPLYFHPLSQRESRFRYLGQEDVDKHLTYVVAFAQLPSAGEAVRLVVNRRAPVLLRCQGLAWIDPANFQIVRMQTDLMAPVPAINLESQTTRIKLGEFHFKSLTLGLWLPRKVEVETRFAGVTLWNTHSYSEFKQFTVQTNERQAALTSRE